VFSSPDIELVPSLTLPAPRPAAEPHCFIGVELAQVSDYTAIAIVEQHGKPKDAVYHVRHLERIERGTPYPLVVARVATLARHPAIVDRSTLAVDQTGVGRAVVDLLRAEKLKPQLMAITITGGDAVIRDGMDYHTPKRDLVAAVQVLLQTQRLKIAPTLPAAELLTAELEAFQIKLSPAGHDSYGSWREGSHDDLILAVAMAVWVAEHCARHEVYFW
jgi:hypothetical protein